MTTHEFDLIELAAYACDCRLMSLLAMAACLFLTFHYMADGRTVAMFLGLYSAMMAGVTYAKMTDLREAEA